MPTLPSGMTILISIVKYNMTSIVTDPPTTALTKGLRAFLSALVRARGDKGAEIVSVAIELPEHLERRLEQQNQITLVGIRELADLLGVTRQRASQIAATRNFPAPLAKLAAGPVWNKASLTWFLEDWAREPRRPGPKPGSRRSSSGGRSSNGVRSLRSTTSNRGSNATVE